MSCIFDINTIYLLIDFEIHCRVSKKISFFYHILQMERSLKKTYGEHLNFTDVLIFVYLKFPTIFSEFLNIYQFSRKLASYFV